MAKLSVEQALTRAKALEKKGDIAQARALYQGVLRAFPGNAKAKQALSRLPAPKTPAGPPRAVLENLIALYHGGKLGDLAAQAIPLTKTYPQSGMVWNLLGAAHQGLGQLTKAAQAFQAATQAQPDFPDAYNNLGFVLTALDRPRDAVICFLRALELRPDYLEAYLNLAKALRAAGQPKAAAQACRAALDLRSDFAPAHHNLGNALWDLDQLDAAADSFARAVALQPDLLDARNNLGTVLMEMERFEDAITAYRAVLAQQPDHAEVYGNLFELYEKTNQLDQAATLLAEVRTRFDPLPATLKFRSAIYHFRTGAVAEAVDLLRGYDVAEIDPSFHVRHFETLGKSLEKAGDFAAAFAAYDRMNAQVRAENTGWQGRAAAYLNNCQARAAALRDLPAPAPVAAPQGESPVFLVGFPRSGTTLLDTFLRGHPDITVAEEVPAVARAIDRIDWFRDVAAIDALDDATANAMRAAYVTEFDGHATPRGAGLRIDKLPLHLVTVPEIHRMFPRAKYILALRHPMDCILSNYKQNFGINDAMYLMSDPAQAAALYAASMAIFQACRARYDLDVVTLRYEDLVADKEAELRRVVDFLGLPWTDDLLDHRKTAADRGKINTPSYSQVVQPIYRESSYLWENYAAQLAPVQPVLQDWIDRYGYGAA